MTDEEIKRVKKRKEKKKEKELLIGSLVLNIRYPGVRQERVYLERKSSRVS